MVINIANFNFGGDGGGGGKPALLQEKTATIVQNGSQTITPDEGFDGMSSVQINAAITGDSSAIDFSPIGYNAEFSAEVNSNINNDVAYSNLRVGHSGIGTDIRKSLSPTCLKPES